MLTEVTPELARESDVQKEAGEKTRCEEKTFRRMLGIKHNVLLATIAKIHI